MITLAEFRSWLISIRDNEEYREKKRRNGTVDRYKQGNMGFGPFNWKARKLILRILLETQKMMGYELITLEELKAIDEIWDQELDLSRRVLVELYEDITGEKLPWYDYKLSLIHIFVRTETIWKSCPGCSAVCGILPDSISFRSGCHCGNLSGPCTALWRLSLIHICLLGWGCSGRWRM